VTIRKAQPADVRALTELAQQACRTGGYPDDWISKSDLNISEEYLAQKNIFIAEQDSECLGFYVLAGDGSELEQMWVASAHFGSGVGKELFLHAKNISHR
jgi:N-acetylglutamate synthase-like GNAT family acetyltransferase